MHAFVLDDEVLNREIAGEPDMALAGREVELGVGLRAHAEPDIRRALVAHDRVRHVVLDDLQLRPALDFFVADDRASGGERGEEREQFLHARDPCGAPVAPGTGGLRPFGSNRR